DAVGLISADRFLKYDYFAMLEQLEPLAQSMPEMKQIIHVGERPYRDSLAFQEVFARGRCIDDTQVDLAWAAVEPNASAYMPYTSGSTSTPTGIQLQH